MRMIALISLEGRDDSNNNSINNNNINNNKNNKNSNSNNSNNNNYNKQEIAVAGWRRCLLRDGASRPGQPSRRCQWIFHALCHNGMCMLTFSAAASVHINFHNVFTSPSIKHMGGVSYHVCWHIFCDDSLVTVPSAWR
ncbi:unnamed protein product [Polarella glacialis]|uniref:Uncharacterized protein n=1 Tax=Polarella glacialis TaxID=89957 RepID=A0A813EGT0_POLGL|nr:unnamed protein product [Polarella glacialis]